MISAAEKKLAGIFTLPAGRESFRVEEVSAILCHSKDQIFKLIDGGALKVIDTAAARSIWRISRAELAKFILSRTFDPARKKPMKKGNLNER
jgi:hypothetical protein